MKRALFFAFCYCLFGRNVNAQTDFTYDMTWTVSDSHFTMGKTVEKKNASIAIRTDSIHWASTINCAKRNRSEIEFSNAFSRAKIKITRYGGMEKNHLDQNILIDTNYLDSKMKQQHLVLYGKPKLSKWSKRNVIQLDIPTDCIRTAELNEFPNLTRIHAGIYLRSDCAGYEYYPTYPGVPDFWSSFYQQKNLREIFVVFGNYFYADRPSVYSLNTIDAPKDSLLLLPQLDALWLTNQSFFSVNFKTLKKIKFLHVEGLHYPELVNLALVLHHFKKDKKEGDWTDYLAYADTSRTLNIPENGSYKSYYASGEPLCEGTFKNGVPDGSWKFWNMDGSLSQQRNYENGSREGCWMSFGEFKKIDHLQDTLLIMNYVNDNLVSRSEFANGFADYDENLDKTYIHRAKKVIHYTKKFTGNTIVWKKHLAIINASDELSKSRGFKMLPIIRDTIGDTIETIEQTWEFTPNHWTYTYAFDCKSCETIYSGGYGGCTNQAHNSEYYIREHKKSDGEKMVLTHKQIKTLNPTENAINVQWFELDPKDQQLKLSSSEKYPINIQIPQCD